MMIFDEEKYVKSLLLGKNKDIKSAIKKIGYITRYNAQVLGKDESKNYNSTVAWMTKHQDNFDESSYSNVISKAVKNAKKRKLYKIDDIIVTKSELGKIQSLDNIRAEKILFVLVCMAKQQAKIMDCYGSLANFTEGLVRYTVTELCKMARVSVPADDREYILHYILTQGLISCPKRNDTKCLWVNFIDKDGEEALRLNEIDCQELAYVYLNWKGKEKFKRCTRCGRLMKSKASDNICTACSLSSSLPLQIWCIDCGEVVEVSEFDSKTCRCKDCQNKADYTPIGTKIVKCIDCGKDIKVNSKNNRTHRCDCCQKEYIKKYDRVRKVLNINRKDIADGLQCISTGLKSYNYTFYRFNKITENEAVELKGLLSNRYKDYTIDVRVDNQDFVFFIRKIPFNK